MGRSVVIRVLLRLTGGRLYSGFCSVEDCVLTISVAFSGDFACDLSGDLGTWAFFFGLFAGGGTTPSDLGSG